MDYSFWFDTKTCYGPLYVSRGVRLLFEENNVFFYLKIFFTLTNSVDPDEMRHFSLVFTVCKNICLGVASIHHVNAK